MLTLLLIRHATNDFVKTGRLPGHHKNIHLNTEGRTQAAALAIHLSKHKLSALYASPLERAIETALPVATAQQLPICICNDLADIDTGELTGKEIKDVKDDPRYKDAWKLIVEKPSEGRLPGGESLVEMQTRVVRAVSDIIAAHNVKVVPQEGDAPTDTNKQPPPVVGIVMHNDTIKAALAHFLGMPFDYFQRIGVSPASVSTVMLNDDGSVMQVAQINATA